MANIALLVPIIQKWEGGYVFDPDDPGGHTFMGITLKTWKKAGYDKTGDGNIDADDLRLITYEEMITGILKPYYWDVWQADHIRNQSIANLLVDWIWCSGPRTIVIVQHILELKTDGIVGNRTLTAINNYSDPYELHKLIKAARIYYIDSICEQRPVLSKFKRGWKNRIADFVYSPMILLYLFMGVFTVSCRSAKSTLLTTTTDSIQSIGMRNALSDHKLSSVLSDSAVYREAIHDKLVETVDMFFCLSGCTDSVSSSKALILSGLVHINRVRESVAVSNKHRQQDVEIQNHLAIRQDEEVRQSHVNKTKSMSRQTKDPPAKHVGLFVIMAIILTGFILFVYNKGKH